MAKSIDKLIAYGLTVPDNIKRDKSGQFILDEAYRAVPVVADNVLSQFWGGNADMPNWPLVSPFDVTWVEGSLSTMPEPIIEKHFKEEGHGPRLRMAWRRAKRDKHRVGILYGTQKIEDGFIYGLNIDVDGNFAKIPFGFNPHKHARTDAIPTNAFYWCSVLFFMDLGKRHKKLVGPSVYTGFPLDERGYFMPVESTFIVDRFLHKLRPNLQWANDNLLNREIKKDLAKQESRIKGDLVDTRTTSQLANAGIFTKEDDAKIIHLDLIAKEYEDPTLQPSLILRSNNMRGAWFAEKALLYAIGVMNCKNIDSVLVRPNRKQSKKFERKTGKPLLRYRVITVDGKSTRSIPAHRKHASNTPVGEHSLPLHLRRGHFKTFTEDRPLFGKHAGTYWWNPTNIGDKEQGEIIHEYKIEQP